MLLVLSLYVEYYTNIWILSTKSGKLYTIGYMIINEVSTMIGKRKTTVAEVARSIHVKNETIQNLYMDKTQGIKFNILNKLCWYLECTPNDLLRYIPDEQPPVEK